MDKFTHHFNKPRKSFEEFYAADIEPCVNWRSHRIGKKFRTVSGICFVILIIWMRFTEDPSGYHLIHRWDGLIFFIGLLGCVLLLVSTKYRQSLSNSYIMQKLADAQNLFYRPRPKSVPEGLSLACKQGFIPQFDIGYGLWGDDGGVLVDLVNVKWIEVQGKSVVPHQGFYVLCHLRMPVQGYTVLVPDGLKAKFNGQMAGLKRIKLEWVAFEEKFDLFSTDEKEARKVFAPDVMEAIYDLYIYLNKRAVCFVFYKEQLACFYNMGPNPPEISLVEKKTLSRLFGHILGLRNLPSLMQHKGLAAAWQDKEHLQQRKEEYIDHIRKMKEEHFSSQQQSAAVNTPDVRGITPIMHSIIDNNQADFELHVNDPYLQVNQQFAGNGNTLLHLAAANNRLEMVRVLLEHKDIQPNVRNDLGETVLDLARKRGCDDVVNLLEEYFRK